MGSLLNSFTITKLDLESPSPTGFNRLDTSTSFGSNNTGTPTDQANPGPPLRFFQRFIPQDTYLQYVRGLSNRSNLLNLRGFNSTAQTIYDYTVFDATNLDVERSGVNGGIPYKQDKDPTVYPKYVSGTPTIQANPGPVNKFNQVYNPKNVYVDNVGRTTSKLTSTVANTNLDVEDPRVDGGIPYKTYKDPTIYPALNTGTPSTTTNPGAPSKFNQVYDPKNTYLSKVPIKSDGLLKSTVANTNLDVEDPRVDGGIPYKQVKDPTTYPVSTQKRSPSRGPYPVQGQGATKYDQIFSPTKTYSEFIKKFI